MLPMHHAAPFVWRDSPNARAAATYAIDQGLEQQKGSTRTSAPAEESRGENMTKKQLCKVVGNGVTFTASKNADEFCADAAALIKVLGQPGVADIKVAAGRVVPRFALDLVEPSFGNLGLGDERAILLSRD